jgi:hypothetical protein
MMRRSRLSVRSGIALAGVLGAVLGFGASPAVAAPRATLTTVARGFDNPRGLAFGEHGQLYVAEAGKGGPKCVSGGPGGDLCPGLTGAISVITKHGAHHRIVSGLASIAGRDGSFATGPDGLSRSENGELYTIITSCPQQIAQLPHGAFSPSLVRALKAQVGQDIEVEHHGHLEPKAGVGRFDWNWSLTHKNLVPGQFPDCNPYAILAGEHDQWVVDAATNTLDHVSADGDIKIVAFFPNPAVSDAVPTCLDRGPDGALYIGELTGGGNRPGSSVVWRVDTDSAHPTPTVWARGLTAVTGCGFADGEFYATEFSTKGLDAAAPGTGAVVRVPPHSTSPIVVADKLSFPNGFAAHHHAIYVSNWSISPAVIHPGGPPLQPGEVVRINLHDCRQ